MPFPTNTSFRDGNHTPVASGQSNGDSSKVLPFLIDSITGRVLVDNSANTVSAVTTTYNLSATQSGNDALVTLPTISASSNLVLLIRNGQALTLTTDYTVSTGVATVFNASASDSYIAIVAVGTGSSSIVATNTELVAWTNAVSYTLPTITRDSNEAITTATVVWPDGSTGVFTTLVASVSFPGAVDSYQITYIPSSGATKTVTQPTVTRDAAGAVTAQPLLVIS